MAVYRKEVSRAGSVFDRPIRLAVFSGVIPSTTFIEQMIKVVARDGIEVLLFGTLHEPTRYPNPRVKIFSNRPGLAGMAQGLGRILWLLMARYSHYRKLKQHIGKGPFSDSASFSKWQKVVPVVLHLPDVFHVQWAKAAGDWIFLKDLFGVKMVLSLRGAHINYSPLANSALARQYREVFPKYDAFHAVSKAIAREAERYGAAAEKISVIYSGLPEPANLPERSSRTGVIRLLAVGRIHWKKGYHVLLDALASLMAEGNQFRLTLIARGEMTEELAYQIHQLGLSPLVHHIPGLSHREVLEQMRQHDLLVLPSLEEGIANVALEAMSVGLPVVSTDCGGMGEVIEDGQNGWLVPVRDAAALKRAIERASKLPAEQLDAVRKEAHKAIQSRFSDRLAMAGFSQLYRKVIECA